MDGNGKPGRRGATEPSTLLLIVCTRCLGLRKEPLGRATTICECGGHRRILRVVHDEPEAETPPRRGGASRGGPSRDGGARGGASRGGANGAGANGAGANGAGPSKRAARRSPNGRANGRPNGRPPNDSS